MQFRLNAFARDSREHSFCGRRGHDQRVTFYGRELFRPGYSQNWQPYPGYAAARPFGMPFVAFAGTVGYVPNVTPLPVPVRVYYIPQRNPYYNVPPYAVIEPY